jgi:predicted dehydrogenase
LINCRANGISIFGGNEDIAHARLEFGCGAVANLTASRCSFESKRSIQIFGTDGFANVDLASRTVQMVPVPAWIKDRNFDFQALTLEQKQFVRDNLFTEILPKTEMIVPATNAILDEQRDWISAISTGGPVRNSGIKAVAAVEIASRVLHCIHLHNWDPGLPNMTGAFSTPPINQEQAGSLPDFLVTDSTLKWAA